LDVKTPPSTDIFFNLLGFFVEENLKTKINFTVHIKKILNTSSKNFWVPCQLPTPSSFHFKNFNTLLKVLQKYI